MCWGTLLTYHVGSSRPKIILPLMLGRRIHPNIHTVNLARFKFGRFAMLPSARNTIKP